LELHCIVNGLFQENTWLVGDGAGAGMIVDPGYEIDRVVAFAEEAGIPIDQIVCTHGHIDHAAGVSELKERTGAPFSIHAADVPMLDLLPESAARFGLEPPAIPTVDRELADGDEIVVGSLTFRVIHTPGHTPGGVCLACGDDILTGDSLFAGGIGRVDLPGGSWAVYQRTLRDVILSWPDSWTIHPGHGPDSTVGAERVMNPYLSDLM